MRRGSGFLISLLFLGMFSALAQRKPVTLDAMSEIARRPATGPGTGLWAPDGKTFVFRQDGKLKIYDPARQSAQDLVETKALDQAAVKVPDTAAPFAWENRNVRESAMQWSASGKELMYVSGGDVFLIHVDTGKWDQLTKTPVAEHDAKLSPDGKTLAFRRGWDLYTVDAASGQETRLTRDGTATLRNGALDWVYPEELQLGTAYWWSPDSKSIAYLQSDISREPIYPHEDLRERKALYEPQRYPQAGDNNPEVHLGIVSASGGATKWLDVGDTRNSYLIARVGWMPDAQHVYVVRPNRIQNRTDLLSYSVADGSAVSLLRESDRYWVNTPSDPQFLSDGKRFLWLSERDGFRHIYLYTSDGRDAKQITKGSWEVSTINSVDEAAQRIYYSSTESSPVDRQLYSIEFDGSGKKQLSQGVGNHTISMGRGSAFYLDTYSDTNTPSSITLHANDGKAVATYREADRRILDEYEIARQEMVSFKGPDGTVFYGQLTKPVGFDPAKKYPAIVQVYGGPDAQAVRNFWSGVGLDQVLANRGFVVWEMDNRGSTGRGHAFETPIFHNLGAVELADQKAGVDYLVSLGFVDPQKIGINGWSYGGFMVLNALLNAPDTFHAGIAGAPVTSWYNYDSIYTERFMGLPQDNAEAYDKTALAQHAGKLKGKLMIVHNLEDDNVLFQNTLQIMDALQLAGKQFEFMLYPQKTHGVSGPASRQMNASMLDFFERTLK